MRSDQDILSLILDTARTDGRIRAVFLGGSRSHSRLPPDPYQDFDVIYAVTELESFARQPEWIDVFGERIILQMPDGMQLSDAPPSSPENRITYLMLLTDGHRIDLRLMRIPDVHRHLDSLQNALLDKDGLFDELPPPSDRDYRIRKPTPVQFRDCCNEFWWVCPYVLKGLLRDQITYAKDSMERPVRSMFLRMVGWQVGVRTGFSANLGQSSKFLQQYVSPSQWERILSTYPDADRLRMWNSLREMTRIFDKAAREVADHLGYRYHAVEAERVSRYLDRTARGL